MWGSAPTRRTMVFAVGAIPLAVGAIPLAVGAIPLAVGSFYS